MSFVWNIVRITINIFFPLIVLPYTTRALGPEYFGKTEYAAAFVSYFVLFTAIGIPLYGVREIARNQNDKKERSKVVRELSVLLCAAIAAGYIIYFPLVLFVPVFRADLRLLLIIAPTVLLTNCNCEWFYTGMEQQKSIAFRTLITRTVQAVLIVCFVKEPEDFTAYIIITVFVCGIQAVWNILGLKKFMEPMPFAETEIDIKRHIKPLIAIFTAAISISVYTNIDTLMVGIIAGDKAVGIYAAANKIIRLIIIFITLVPAVFIPRLESALHSGNIKAYQRHLDNSLRLHLFFAVPFIFGVFLLAPEVIRVMTGAGYEDAILSSRLLSPIIIIVPLANFAGFHVLYPHRKEKYYTIAVCISALVNIVGNLCLIPRFGHNGAIIGTLAAEVSGLCLLFRFAGKLLPFKDMFSVNSSRLIAASIIMAASIYFIKPLLNDAVLVLTVCTISGAFIYCIALLLLGEETSKSFVNQFINQFIRRNTL